MEGLIERQSKHIQALNIVGLLSGLAAVVSIIVVGDTYGTPGSEAYQTYETFNRVMAILIALESCGLVAFYMQWRNSLGKAGKIAVSTAFIAWIGMAVGTAAEFWLFSDLPYRADNMRSFAFSFFSMSSLIAGLALLFLGLRSLLNGKFPRYVGTIFLLYLPFDIAMFFSGQSIFLTSALFSISIATVALNTYLRHTRKS